MHYGRGLPEPPRKVWFGLDLGGKLGKGGEEGRLTEWEVNGAALAIHIVATS